MDVTDGCNVFLNGGSVQTVSVEGLAVDLSQELMLDAYMMNLLPYLPQECMAVSDVFAGYESDLLVVKSDESDYYVPSFGVETLTEMCPGEAYAVFLNGASDLSFTYPMGTLASLHNDAMEDYRLSTRAGAPAATGESHLILITDVQGDIMVGDQLRAYSNGSLVGSINIVSEHLSGAHPIDLVAVGGVDLSVYGGPVLYGYEKGEAIEIRHYSNGMEYRVEADLSDSQYGNAMEMSVGTVSVSSEGVNPTEFGITGNYPNPFNPSTTIEYNVEASGQVSLTVYDIMGRTVRTLVDEYKESGRPDYKVVWDGKDDSGQQVSAGLYLYTLRSGGMASTAKMVLMK